MTDVHSKNIRAYNMSRIRAKDTKPELLVRQYLFANGFRYRLHVKSLPGKPDIVLKKHNIIIFIHGCFWHQHLGCKYFVIPKTRTVWWMEKLNKNVMRDEKAQFDLEELGWTVLIVWECQLRSKSIQKTLEDLLSFLKKV